MSTDCQNLQIKLVRGRTQTVTFKIGTWVVSGYGIENVSWVPTDISTWYFSFTMRSNYTLKQPNIAVAYNPIVNMADPTLGQLMWNILGKDTESLLIGNYVFDMTVTMPPDMLPRFFCGGHIPLFDNVTDVVNLPTKVAIQTGINIKA